MPTLRSRKRTQSTTDKSELQENKLPTMAKNKNEEISQWVMIGPEKLFLEDDMILASLPHPQNGVVSLFAFKENKAFEMMKYKETYRSWLIDESVQKDGALTMLTSIDPLFLVLPFLQKSYSTGNFTTLDNILIDDNFTPALRKLELCLSREMLQNVCDCKGSDDLIVYKANQDKIMDWLSKKVQKMSTYFERSSINVKHGAQISGFVRNSDGQKNAEDCLRYAWAMVSDYVTEEISQNLKEKFKIQDALKSSSTTAPPAAKRQKLESDGGECLEDYRDKNSSKKKFSGATPKLSRSLKQLDKVDKKGMKTMGSFFKAKPKK